MKEKYADQDEEERQLRLELLGVRHSYLSIPHFAAAINALPLFLAPRLSVHVQSHWQSVGESKAGKKKGGKRDEKKSEPASSTKNKPKQQQSNKGKPAIKSQGTDQPNANEEQARQELQADAEVVRFRSVSSET
jgi:hypothetical protein